MPVRESAVIGRLRKIPAPSGNLSAREGERGTFTSCSPAFARGTPVALITLERHMSNMGIERTGPSMRRLLIGASLAGAAAGGLNAWLCYAGLPRPIAVHPQFTWDIVPAGVLHGGILAVAGCLGALWNHRARWARRLLTAATVGWVAGYVSWQPLRMSLDRTFGWSLWPFDQSWPWLIASPFAHFGLVASILCVVWGADRRTGVGSVAVTLAAGIGGSLWWWIAYEQWYLSLLHGAIWGTAVGLSVWSHASAAVTVRGQGADVAPRSTRPSRRGGRLSNSFRTISHEERS
jgi:hypothetical protein